MAIRRFTTLKLANTVGAHFQGSAGGNFRIQLTQTAGGGIARIDKGFVALGDSRCIDLVEATPGQINFTAHFE